MKPSAQECRRANDWQLLPWVALAFALTVTVWIWYLVRADTLEAGSARFQRQTEQACANLLVRLSDYERVLRGARALFDASHTVERDEWHAYVSSLDLARGCPGIQSMGFARRVPAQELSKHVAAVRAAGFADYALWPAEDRPAYFPVEYLEPDEDRNRWLFGVDLYSQDARRAAMDRACDENRAVITPKLALLIEGADPERQNGFLLFLPVYRNGAPCGTAEERRAALAGFVFHVFRARDMLRTALANDMARMDIAIYDGTQTSDDSLYYDSTFDCDCAGARPHPSLFRHRETVAYGGRTWALRFASCPSLSEALNLNRPRVVLAIGLVFSGLLFLLTRVAASRYRHIAHEATLSDRLRVLAGAVEQSPATIVITDTTGQIVYVNPKSCRLTGYTAEEVIGRNPRLFKSGETPESVYKAIWEAVQAGREWNGELLNRRKDGTRFWERALITCLRDAHGTITHYLKVAEDVTELKREREDLQRAHDELEKRVAECTAELTVAMAELKYEIVERARALDAVQASERKLRALFDSAFQFIGLLEPDGAVLEVNRAVLEFTGRSRDAMDGRRIWESPAWAYDPDVQATLKNSVGRAAAGEFVRYSVELRGKNNRAAIIDFSLTPVRDDAGHVFLLIAEGHDITALRETEDELRRSEARILQLNADLERRVEERTAQLKSLADDLTVTNAALARAARLKDEFVASMSHELRTPLTAVLGLSDALLEEVFGPLTDQQRKSLQTIGESGRHLLDLINDILDLSKIEAGKVELAPREVSAENVCQACLRMIATPAMRKSLGVHYARDPRVTTVCADERRLKQMLMNLLGNAIKFTPEKGHIGLEVKADPDNCLVRFSVWDTGVGIDGKDIPHLFQPFVQLKGGYDRPFGGTGLGLSLVQRMAELHGGRVEVSSEPGGGSWFTLVLPWWTKEAHATEEAEAPAVGPTAVACANAHLLLVDDDEANVFMISSYLIGKGYRVTAATSGQEALDKAAETTPDLVLMDIQMPGMDGCEAIRRLRAISALAKIPVIALTALAMDGDRERCRAAGADESIAKPIRLAELVRMIERWLRRKA